MALVRRSLDAAVARSATDPRHREELQLGSLGEDSVVFAVPGPDYGDIVIIRRGDLVANIDLSQSTPPDHQLTRTIAEAADRRLAHLLASLTTQQ